MMLCMAGSPASGQGFDGKSSHIPLMRSGPPAKRLGTSCAARPMPRPAMHASV